MPEQILGASGDFVAYIDSTGALKTSAVSTIDFGPIAGSPTENAPGSCIVLGGIDSSTGSISYFTATNNQLNVNATVSTGSGMVLYSGAITNIADVTSGRLATQPLGSVEVSSIVGALPAGTNLIGSVVANIVGLSTSDYVSIVGSPNYNLPIIGSVQVSNSAFTPISIIGSPNYSLPVSATVSTGSGMVLYSGAITNIADVTSGRLATSTLGSIQVSSVLGTTDIISIGGSINVVSLPAIGGSVLLNAGTSLIGSVVADIVGLSTSDYVSVVGSPNYNLPIIGSVQVSSITGALPAGTAVIGSVLAKITEGTITTGSGMVLYSGAITNIADVTSGRLATSTLGSVQVSSITGALPAGTALLGSVVADIVGLSTADYISIVGSPNYNLPVIGSVQVSSITGALPAGTAILGSVKADVTNLPSLPAGTNLIGSVVANIVGLSTSDYVSIVGSPNYNLPIIGSIQVSSIVGALPAGTALLGSVVADIVGLSTSDYVSVVGSPNYNLPVIGSVEISNATTVWTGIGSIVNSYDVKDGSSLSFSWVGALTGSTMGIPATGSRFNITDIICSASGQGIVTLFFNTNNLSNRIAKAHLANFGGFVNNYSKSLRGPIDGSLIITTAATGFTPVGDVTVSFFQSN